MKKTRRPLHLDREYEKGNVQLTTRIHARSLEYLGSIQFTNPWYDIRVWTDGKALYTCDEPLPAW